MITFDALAIWHSLTAFETKQLKNKHLHPIGSTFVIIVGRTRNNEEKRKEYVVVGDNEIRLVRTYLYS